MWKTWYASGGKVQSRADQSYMGLKQAPAQESEDSERKRSRGREERLFSRILGFRMLQRNMEEQTGPPREATVSEAALIDPRGGAFNP